MRATPFDYNRDLEDALLSAGNLPAIHLIEGTNFFRGLALIDLAEAMLKRAFGNDAVAVRVNGAGQGDFFQVHVDTMAAMSRKSSSSCGWHSTGGSVFPRDKSLLSLIREVPPSVCGSAVLTNCPS